MEITESFDIPATVDAVLTALADEGYHARRAADAGALAHTCTVARHGDSVVVTARWELPASDLPPAARAIVGPRLVLQEDQRWRAAEDGAVGALRIAFEGVDLSASGTMTLVPHAGGSRERIVARLTSAMPFLGAQVAATAAPVLAGALRAEAATAAAWFSSR